MCAENAKLTGRISMKRITAMLICLILLFSGSVYAYTFPSGFFDINSKYIAAKDSGDLYGMIKYGTEIIKMMKSEPDCDEKRNVLISRYDGVAGAYEKLGDYPAAAEVYQEFYDYAIAFGDKYYDYTRPSREKAMQYRPAVTIMTDGGSDVYFGAKNERKDGVLYGLCSDSAVREELGDESMILLYLELGDEITGYTRKIMQEAKDGGKAVEFALNCKDEGADIDKIYSFEPSLAELSELFSEYSSVPVYLRFAAEFDVWQVPSSPDSFKAAFRFVSSYFKSKNPNVAMVWSMTPSAAWGVNIDDFYPGDEFVDWVGTTLYSQKYFNANPSSSALDSIIFKSGDSSDPVLAIRDIVKKYGSKKPIMISESGSGHKVMSTGEDTTDFALRRMAQLMYYIPMMYPEVKLMTYFDRYIEGSGEKSDYRISTNEALKREYLKASKRFRFVQGGFEGSSPSGAFRELYGAEVDRVFPLYCYAHKFGSEAMKVTYFVDGVYAATSSEIPFEAYIDASKLSGATHKVKSVVLFSDGTTLENEVPITLSGGVSSDINVEISGKFTQFDSTPLICNGRTMVPMRKIFEELGASVSWDGETKTVVGTKGYKKVVITVGSKTMLVDGEKVLLDAVPIVISGRTLVPVRAIAEGLGATVSWDDSAKTVKIELI